MVEQAGALGYFGDARRAAVGTELIERVTATGSLVIRKLGATRAGELAIHRFLSAPSVTCQEMLATLAGRTQSATAGRRIVVAQDTTEINFAGRAANRCGLGAAGDGVSAGFFIHPLVAIDSETEAVLGLLDAQIWTREDAIEAAPRRQRAIEDKESMRWLRGVERAGALLTDAASVVVVGDRESDIYSCFARRAAGVDLIVRAAQDRLTAGARQGPAGDASLFTSPAAWPELTQMLVKVAPRRVGDPGRIATVALRAGPVILKRPRHGSAKTDPETVAMTLVEAREINPPANQEPLHWRLLTSLEVGDAEAACEIVRLYRLRWRIDIDQAWRLSRISRWMVSTCNAASLMEPDRRSKLIVAERLVATPLRMRPQSADRESHIHLSHVRSHVAAVCLSASTGRGRRSRATRQPLRYPSGFPAERRAMPDKPPATPAIPLSHHATAARGCDDRQACGSGPSAARFPHG